MKSLALCILFAFAFTAFSYNASEWATRTIYQVLTDRFARTDGDTTPCSDFSDYCGGTFQGLINNLDYIANMGFDAIWISPVVANTPEGYHGYWAQNIYEINSFFGTAQDLTNFVNACHERDIWVMFDVVANHMGTMVGAGDFSDKVPFNDTSYYHTDIDCSQINQNDQSDLETCWLYQLPDLDQDNDFVRTTLLNWITDLVSNYSVDGLRIDTVPYVAKDFWTDFTTASGVYTVGEIYNGDIGYVAGYQGPISGVINYPYYFTIIDVFQQYGSMNNLQNYFNAASGWPNANVLANFVDNHDTVRFLNYNGDHVAFKSALAFTLTVTGIPSIYYGDEQAFGGGATPFNREPLWTNFVAGSEIYQYLTTVIGFRKQYQIWQYPQIQRYSSDNFYAFSRGDYFFAFTNTQNDVQVTITYHPYSDGTVICNALADNDCVTVSNGQFPVDLNGGEVKLFAPQSGTQIQQ